MFRQLVNSRKHRECEPFGGSLKAQVDVCKLGTMLFQTPGFGL